MPHQPTRVNRGPAAGPSNRAAILQAARRLFRERGLRVPYNAIARAAGVGDGVLYRHFPARHALAFAVFEDNFTALEEAAGSASPDAFERLWKTLLDQTARESAFVELLLDSRSEHAPYDGKKRLQAIIDRALTTSQREGAVAPGLSSADVMLSWRMAFGIVLTAPTVTEAHHALQLMLSTPRRSGAGQLAPTLDSEPPVRH